MTAGAIILAVLLLLHAINCYSGFEYADDTEGEIPGLPR